MVSKKTDADRNTLTEARALRSLADLAAYEQERKRQHDADAVRGATMREAATPRQGDPPWHAEARRLYDGLETVLRVATADPGAAEAYYRLLVPKRAGRPRSTEAERLRGFLVSIHIGALVNAPTAAVVATLATLAGVGATPAQVDAALAAYGNASPGAKRSKWRVLAQLYGGGIAASTIERRARALHLPDLAGLVAFARRRINEKRSGAG